MLTGRRCGGTPVMSWPSISTRPASGVSKPAIMRSKVVLPQPEPPSSANSSPRGISRSTPSTATIVPKRLLAPAMLTIGSALKSSSRLHHGPQPRALARLLGVAGGDGVELGAHVGRRIDQRIGRDVLGQERARRRRDLGLEQEIEEAQGVVGIGRILGDGGDVDPQERAFARDGVGDVLLVFRFGGAVPR